MINEFLDVYRRRRDCFMVCRKCGAEIKDGDMFCARCGTRTEKAESSSQGYYQTEERTVICKYCGKLIPEKSVGCPYCGKIIGKNNLVVHEVPISVTCYSSKYTEYLISYQHVYTMDIM